MCILMSSTGKHVDVAATKIFARLDRAANGPEMEQYLVYQMNINAHGARSAMILPIPEATHQDNAVEFINLQGYKDFFTDCEKGFPAEQALSFGAPMMRGIGAPKGLLAVERVGDYIASWVPTVADLDRLDPVFRMPKILFDAFPRYETYGFAVFQLDTDAVGRYMLRRWSPSGSKTTIQPMALRFETATPNDLYFPTVHFHGDGLHDMDEFDHMFYWQNRHVNRAQISDSDAGYFMDVSKAGDIIDSSAEMYRLPLVGKLVNKDTWIKGEMDTMRTGLKFIQE